MDPVTLFALGKTLLQSGPGLVRGVGALFGGKKAEIANRVAGFVEEVTDLPEGQRQQRLQERLAGLDPDALVTLEKVHADLEVELARIEAAREAERLQAETAQQAQAQDTRRVEAQSTDAFVRQTRPLIARRSANFAFAYIVVVGMVFPLIQSAVSSMELPGLDWMILAAIYAPALEYNGVRTLDKWRMRKAG